MTKEPGTGNAGFTYVLPAGYVKKALDKSLHIGYNYCCRQDLRSWRNRQTRTFEGRMGNRPGSSPGDRTIKSRFCLLRQKRLFIYLDLFWKRIFESRNIKGDIYYRIAATGGSSAANVRSRKKTDIQKKR